MKRVILTLLVALFALSASAQELNVASFNIRNGAPLKEGKERPTKGKSDYVKYNGWDDRKQILCDMINFEAFDIFGSQEVRKVQLDEMLAMLPDYDYIGVGRNDGKTSGEYAAIFYKKDRFELIEWGIEWYTAKPGTTGFDAATPRNMTWAHLRDKKSTKEFFCISSHFDHKGKEAKCMSSYILLDVIKRLSGSLPVIVCGDFNDTPHSRTLRPLTENGRLTCITDTLSGSYRYKGHWQQIDHIYLSPALLDSRHTLHLSPHGAWIPDDVTLMEPEPLYGGYRPHRTYNGLHYEGGTSDHLPVCSDLEFSW